MKEVKHPTDFNTLKLWESNGTTVKEILADWFGVCEKDLMSILCEEGNIVEFWADNNDLSVKDLIDWIEASLNNKANFKIVGNNAINGCAPICELDLGANIVIELDYDFDTVNV